MSLNYNGGDLYLENQSKLSEIIESNDGQACYVYHLGNLKKRYKILSESLSGLKKLSIHYAVKANANPKILKTMKSIGASVDIVSGGEMDLALENGFKSHDVIFSGVAKTKNEILKAIKNNIKQINVESTQELIRIGEIAKNQNKKVSVAFRMNPEVSPDTHPYITTGMSENKFGMDRSFIPELVRILKQYPGHIHLRGLTMHIGSQLLELGVVDEAIQKLLSIYHEFEVLGFTMESLDIGGGVGIHYNHGDEEKDFEIVKQYGEIVTESLKDFKGEVIIEPGRVLVGRCGVLLCQVEYIKETNFKNFAIVNTGMHHIMRPALYQANHRILSLKESKKSKKLYDVVGPICESSDFLGKNRTFSELEQGDYLAICDAGAYGFAMANNYNAHEMPKEIVIS